MTREERLELLKQIEKDIHVCSLESTLLDDAKSCAIHSVIEELEQEPCEDTVSRQAVIETIFVQGSAEKLEIDFAKLLLLQRAIKALPSVIPQEQFQPMIEIDLDYVIKQKYIERNVLDKIRAEIKKEIDRDDHADEYCDGYYDGMRNALAIIDKYKAESENKK